MNCASSATLNAEDEKMISGFRKIVFVMAAVVLSVLFLYIDFSGATVQFRYITSIYNDDKGVELRQPEGIVCDDTSLLLVADTGNGRLVRYSFKDGAVEGGTVEIKVEQMSYPIKTEINSKGEIYVLDRKQRNIIRMTPKGDFRGYLRPVGLPSPASYVPRSFSLDSKDNIYILDILSQRVLILNSEGIYQRQISFPKKYGFFSDVTVDFQGNVLLLDSVNGMVVSAAKNAASFSPLSASLKEYVRFPASLTTDNRGRIYLVDRNGGRVIVLGQDGSFIDSQSAMGWKEGFLNYPSQMCINNKGEAFVTDTLNSRVQIFKIVE